MCCDVRWDEEAIEEGEADELVLLKREPGHYTERWWETNIKTYKLERRT